MREWDKGERKLRDWMDAGVGLEREKRVGLYGCGSGMKEREGTGLDGWGVGRKRE